jgi:hypothetical protein
MLDQPGRRDQAAPGLVLIRFPELQKRRTQPIEKHLLSTTNDESKACPAYHRIVAMPMSKDNLVILCAFRSSALVSASSVSLES